MDNTERTLSFREVLLQDLELLLLNSLTLTRNGPDAMDLLRESVAVAHQSWDGAMQEGTHRTWLQGILSRQFHNRSGRLEVLPKQDADTEVESIDARMAPILPAAKADTRHNSFSVADWDDDIQYFDAIAGLPALFRSVMILSYLEEFSNGGRQEQNCAQPGTTDSFFGHVRRFRREVLFAELMGQGGIGVTPERAAVEWSDVSGKYAFSGGPLATRPASALHGPECVAGRQEMDTW